jgi:anaerobic ribonucleoside-triphosphate reductase activating protein
MNYHNITQDDMLNGSGLRTVLWVSGCTHCCEECQNQITWDVNGGIPFDGAAEEELFDNISKDYIDGVTFSGGDPLHPKNRDEITRLAKKIRKDLPNKTIWLYTGFTWDKICELEIVNYLDVVVDGRFVKELKDVSLHWRGSSNQRVIDVKKTLESGSVVLFDI